MLCFAVGGRTVPLFLRGGARGGDAEPVERMERNYSRLIDQYLGPQGKLGAELGRFEHRPEQIAMARAVLQTLAEAGVLVVEAGTGTGKTLAYLLPILLAGEKVIVSTGTKNLQEQIMHKDLPLLRKHLSFRAALMKGRTNYLCWHRYRRFVHQPEFPFREEIKPFERIRQWAETTRTGDRAEVPDLPDDYLTWRELSATAEQCLGANCEDFEHCFVTRMRREAQDAQLVVVNHALFFADLSVRETGFGEVIPRAQTLVFDEAHGLADTAADYFGIQVSTYRLTELVHDVRRAVPFLSLSRESGHELRQELEQLEQAAARFFPAAAAAVGSGRTAERGDEARRFRFRPEQISAEVTEAATILTDRLQALAIRLDELGRQDEAVKLLAERGKKIAAELNFLLAAADDESVYWLEQRGPGVFLRQTPIELGPLLAEKLFQAERTLVFTSATLATRHGRKWSFNYFKHSLGLNLAARPIVELQLDSSFDFAAQSILYLPEHLPAPEDSRFCAAAAEEMARIVEVSRGRAFLLFTSWRNLSQVHHLLAGRLDYPLLVQGEQPRSALLHRFKSLQNAVLFATQSFWEGVDVVGPALSAVVIDKLPFAAPTEPVIEARIERIRKLGGNPFQSFQLPAAVIALKQGLGRLIRTREDFGVLSVLDPRLHTRSYGRIFLASLPEMPRAKDLEEVRAFFARHEAQAPGAGQGCGSRKKSGPERSARGA